MSEAAIAGYELWDVESRNLLDDFDSEADALAAVRALIALNGADATRALALTQIGADGRMTTVAMGEALSARADSATSEAGRLPA